MDQKDQIVGESKVQFEGEGPGRQTRDGCSVDFYLLLKPKNEPALIAEHVPKNGKILELGCGVGRITHPLVEMGFQVTAVDNSAEMLAHVKGAETICADIETLDLDRKFDAVLLMSHMINIPDAETRQAILQTCQRHLKKDGVVLIQCHNPAVWDRLKVGHLGTDDGIATYLDRLERDGSKLSATLRWQINKNEWSQTFETRLLNKEQIREVLSSSGLKVKKWIGSSQSWLKAY